MNTSDTILTLGIYEPPLPFKPIKEGGAAIFYYCKAEFLWGEMVKPPLMELGKGWDQPCKPFTVLKIVPVPGQH